jgi:divalent metal cation (Fe/Co/Zn/Cd) transporter
MIEPPTLKDPLWNYVVLACAAVFEGISFAIAWRQFAKQRGDTPLWQALRASKDPANYTVLAEDFAALVGLGIAAAGVFASERLQMPRLDGAASALIGVLLAAVATLLIRESRGLLVGEGIKPETADAIRAIVRAEPGVRDVGAVLSMYIGAEEVLVTLDVLFDPATPAGDTAAAIHRIEHQIRERFPKIRRIYIEGAGAGETPRLHAAPAG